MSDHNMTCIFTIAISAAFNDTEEVNTHLIKQEKYKSN